VPYILVAARTTAAPPLGRSVSAFWL